MIRMMNGNDLRMLTILLRISFRTGMGLIPAFLPGVVTQSRIPIGSPRMTENRVERDTISNVWRVLCQMSFQIAGVSPFIPLPPLR